jgi:hypothetical protein
MRHAVVIVAVVVAAVLFGWHHWHHGSSDQSSAVASAIGGSCTQTRYEIINKLAGTKTVIYDCTVGAKRMCVTDENGIAHDSTAISRILFAGTLSGGKPGCLNA